MTQVEVQLGTVESNTEKFVSKVKSVVLVDMAEVSDAVEHAEEAAMRVVDLVMASPSIYVATVLLELLFARTGVELVRIGVSFVRGLKGFERYSLRQEFFDGEMGCLHV